MSSYIDSPNINFPFDYPIYLREPSTAVNGTHFSHAGIGGFFEVPMISDLYAIPTFDSEMNPDGFTSGRRKLGMIVYVIGENKYYQLRPTAITATSNEDYLDQWNAATKVQRLVWMNPVLVDVYDEELSTQTGGFELLSGTGDPADAWVPVFVGVEAGGTGGGGGQLFTSDISVSIKDGKTFGQYKNGDTIPASGKNANEVIIMALFEAMEPTLSLSSSSEIQFGATSATISLNFSKTINTQGATAIVNKIERKRAGDSVWVTLTENINATSPLTDSFNQTQYDTSLVNYRYTVTDSANATKTITYNLAPTNYAAPTISSVNVGSTTRYKGDTVTTYIGTITKNSPLIAITSYQLQRNIDGAGWTNIGSSTSVTGNPATVSVSIAEPSASDSSLKNAASIQYRISVTDTYQTSPLTASTISFLHKVGIVYKSATSISIADIDAAAGLSLSSSRGGTYNNVTAGPGVYTFYVYSSSLGDLTGVIQNGASPVLGAFTKLSNLTGTNSNNSNVSYIVYKSNSTNAFTSATLAFS
jgi:hypothetical protein